jgi:vancomycin permeability regulator SanA
MTKRCLLKGSAAVFAVIAATIIAMVLDVQFRYSSKLADSVSGAQPAPIAIVLGASVQSSGEPSDALRDRLLVAIDLYNQNKVERILVSGDDGQFHIDEIRAMRKTLEDGGIPSDKILEDGHGYRTYESCKRAVQTFDIKSAIIVTQRFHIGRALYLCNKLGMNATGVSSDLTTYQRIIFFTARDLAASVEAWWDINVLPPKSPVNYTE